MRHLRNILAPSKHIKVRSKESLTQKELTNANASNWAILLIIAEFYYVVRLQVCKFHFLIDENDLPKETQELKLFCTKDILENQPSQLILP